MLIPILAGIGALCMSNPPKRKRRKNPASTYTVRNDPEGDRFALVARLVGRPKRTLRYYEYDMDDNESRLRAKRWANSDRTLLRSGKPLSKIAPNGY